MFSILRLAKCIYLNFELTDAKNKEAYFFGDLFLKMSYRQSPELSQRVLSSRLRIDNAKVALKDQAQNNFIWTVQVHRMALCAQGHEEF